MIQPETTFGAMTARPTSRSHTEATKGNPSRAKRSWPARLGEVECYQIALRYAHGEKVVAIAAEFSTTSSWVTHVAKRYGLQGRTTVRGDKAQPLDVEHLRRWARRKAQSLRAQADAWDILSLLD